MVVMEYRLSQNLVVIEEPFEKNNVNQLREILTKTPEPPESLTIDLSKSPMIDTAGIQLLIAMREFMRSKDRELKILFNKDLEEILNWCGVGWLASEVEG
jgi:anti-anti-sigma regulatory factor